MLSLHACDYTTLLHVCVVMDIYDLSNYGQLLAHIRPVNLHVNVPDLPNSFMLDAAPANWAWELVKLVVQSEVVRKPGGTWGREKLSMPVKRMNEDVQCRSKSAQNVTLPSC